MRVPAAGMAMTMLIALQPAPAAACSCMWAGPFLKVAPGAEVIVRARVVDYHGRNRKVDLAMDIEVQEVIKGREVGKRVRVWGDNGAYCRPYVSGFPRGTEWLFAITRLKSTASDPGSAPGDYFINGCGAYWVRVEGESATGHIRAGNPGEPTQAMPLDELRREMRARLE